MCGYWQSHQKPIAEVNVEELMELEAVTDEPVAPQPGPEPQSAKPKRKRTGTMTKTHRLLDKTREKLKRAKARNDSAMVAVWEKEIEGLNTRRLKERGSAQSNA